MSTLSDHAATRRALLALTLAAGAGGTTVILRSHRASADAPRAGHTETSPSTSNPHLPPRVPLASCHASPTATTATEVQRAAGDPRARSAAQRGLSFVS